MNTSPPTKDQVREAYTSLIRALVTTIIKATTSSPLRGVPSGHLYTAVMGVIGLDDYNMIIDKLVATGLVRESNHVLSYTGTI